MGAIVSWVLAEAWPYMFGVLALVGGWFAAKRSGKRQAQRETEAAASEQRRKVNEADSKMVEMDDDDVRRELAKWVRPADPKDR